MYIVQDACRQKQAMVPFTKKQSSQKRAAQETGVNLSPSPGNGCKHTPTFCAVSPSLHSSTILSLQLIVCHNSSGLAIICLFLIVLDCSSTMVLPLATIKGRKRTAATLDTYVVVEAKKVKEEVSLAMAAVSVDEFRVGHSGTVFLDIMKTHPQAVQYGPDSFYIPFYFGSAETDHLLCRLQQELVYVPRDDPRLQFKIFNAINQLPRDKSFLGDVSGKVAPLYRYNPPGNNQYLDVMPWGPTMELIRQSLAVIQFTRHLVANGQQVSRWSGPHRIPVSSNDAQAHHAPLVARSASLTLRDVVSLSVRLYIAPG